jgi:hypothetical protein
MLAVGGFWAQMTSEVTSEHDTSGSQLAFKTRMARIAELDAQHQGCFFGRAEFGMSTALICIIFAEIVSKTPPVISAEGPQALRHGKSPQPFILRRFPTFCCNCGGYTQLYICFLGDMQTVAFHFCSRFASPRHQILYHALWHFCHIQNSLWQDTLSRRTELLA